MHSEARHHTKCARLRLVNKQLALCGSSRIIIIVVVIIIIVIVILRLFLCARCVLPSGSGDCYLCNEGARREGGRHYTGKEHSIATATRHQNINDASSVRCLQMCLAS